MKSICVVYGPPGSGKTANAQAIADYYKCDTIYDGVAWDGGAQIHTQQGVIDISCLPGERCLLLTQSSINARTLDIRACTEQHEIRTALRAIAGTVEPQAVTDAVNHPYHYTHGGIECIDAIAAATHNLQGMEAVCVSQVLKYTWRYKRKNGVEDLRKAQWYLNKLIATLENKDE